MVHKSALPLMKASQLPDGGVNGTLRLAASMSCHALPLLPVRWYCMVLAVANVVPAAVGTSITEIRVGEKPLELEPAPAQIVPGSDRFAFHCSLAVYATDAVTGITFCTNA